MRARPLFAALLVAACSPSSGTAPSAAAQGAPGDAGAAGDADDGAGDAALLDAGLDAKPPPGGSIDCPSGPDEDRDHDGWTVADGDCNDCDANANPGAFDVPGDAVDEDCTGKADDEPRACDGALALDSTDARDGARAIGLCRFTDAQASGKLKTWGVLDARWVRPDRSDETEPLSHGIFPLFGANHPQDGARMLALSTGAARRPSDADFRDPLGGATHGWDKGYATPAPNAHWPQAAPACPQGVHPGPPHDGAGLLVTVRVPTNARSFSVQESLFTAEFPTYVCSAYDDVLVVIVDPPPQGHPDGNVAYDAQKNPLSVNASMMQVCTPQSAGESQKPFACPLGPGALAGTGFEGHAATGWLATSAPVEAGSTITLLFTVWDSADGQLDSTALVDAFAWSADPATIGTAPVPNPK